jgi:LacI family transcriptional regulator
MLAKRDASSAEVAIRCGFTSLQYMYAVFKRELGCTPREYQDSIGLADAPSAPSPRP